MLAVFVSVSTVLLLAPTAFYGLYSLLPFLRKTTKTIHSPYDNTQSLQLLLPIAHLPAPLSLPYLLLLLPLHPLEPPSECLYDLLLSLQRLDFSAVLAIVAMFLAVLAAVLVTIFAVLGSCSRRLLAVSTADH